MSVKEKLNRNQRRNMERSNAVIQTVMESLCQKFHDFYMDNDPEGDEVKGKQKELSAKWKVYFQTHSIKPEFHGLLDDYANKLIESFKVAKG